MTRSDEVLMALRRIMRAVDIRSHQLSRAAGITTPQLVLLRSLAAAPEPVSIGMLAKQIQLSQATTTDIVDRLEKRGFLRRARSVDDRRKVLVALLPEGVRLAERSPTPLQQDFVDRFQQLSEWEQTLILSSLQRLGEMMDAQGIDAAPMLEIQPIVDHTDTPAQDKAAGSDVDG